jgi:hypothetical protein
MKEGDIQIDNYCQVCSINLNSAATKETTKATLMFRMDYRLPAQANNFDLSRQAESV